MNEFPKKIKLHVSQQNIDEGTTLIPWSCPVSLALENLGFQVVIVNKDLTVLRDHKWSRFCYKTSNRARSFIHKFDRGKPVIPSDFVLSMTTKSSIT